MLIHKEELKKLSIIDGTIEWECGAKLSNDTFYIAGEESLLKGCDINGYKMPDSYTFNDNVKVNIYNDLEIDFKSLSL